jgi:hypothetical protein
VAGTVGFAGVCHPETPGLDKEEVPGLVYRGRGRLRVSSNAEMAAETGSLPTLTQNHILRVANATCGVLGAAAGGGSIGSGFIGLASATMVCEADETVFVQTSYDLDVAPEGLGSGFIETECRADTASVQPTPSLTITSPSQGHTSTTASILVGHIFAVANATQGHTLSQAGFGDRSQNVANAQMICSVAAPRMTKRVLMGNPSMGHTTTTVSLQRLYSMGAANATQGHVATASGVTGSKITPVAAIQGHTATPTTVPYLSRTFPHASTDGMIVTAPTLTQNVVDPETGVTAASIFGTGISTTSEGAIPIGSTGTHPNTTAVAIRFKGKRTSTLTSAKVSLRGSGGNSLGQPLLEARILRDDSTSAHKPVDSQRTGVTTVGNRVTYTGTSAHVGSVGDLVSADNTLGRFTFVWSSGAPSLVRNVLYHFELRNVHSDPGNNWTSLDTLFMSPAQSPSQPIALDTDMAVLQRSTGGTWSAQSQHTPIFSLGYADGRSQGQSYLWSPATSDESVTGPNFRVRERFVPTQNLRIHKMAVRAGRWSGSQPLQIRLIRESNGATLASAAGDSGYFPAIDQASTDPRTSHRWYTHSFVSSFTVTAGVTASLDLQTTANAEYRVTFLRQDGSMPASAAFYHGDGQYTTNAGVTWLDASGQSTSPGPTGVIPGDMQFYLGLGSAAPRPVCSADSFGSATGGFVIGNTRTVSARELIVNDLNPSGTHSATTNFPTGVNPLVINHANSATNCAVVMSTAGQTIAVSAKASTGSFTYVARDIYGQRSSARVSIQAQSSAAAPPATGKKPIYVDVFNGAGLSSTLKTAYNVIDANWTSILAVDANFDGLWDGATSDWLGGRGMQRADGLPTNSYVMIDWESTQNNVYFQSWDRGVGGIMRPTSPDDALGQDIAEREGIEAINDARNRRPNVRWAFYNMPTAISPQHFQSVSNSHTLWTTQYQRMSVNFLSRCHAMMPRCYVTAVKNNSMNYQTTLFTNISPWGISEAGLAHMHGNIAVHMHRCADKVEDAGFPRPECIPVCSVTYFGSGLGSLHNTAVTDNNWIYQWIYSVCNTQGPRGDKADGVYMWIGGFPKINTEAQIKAIYQAVNGLPYDPSMPRPS